MILVPQLPGDVGWTTSDTYSAYKVDPETVGQFTGLTDDDGKELYEGDIVSNEVAKWEVIFNKGCFCGKHIDGKSDGTQDTHIALRAIRGKKLIGNIYTK